MLKTISWFLIYILVVILLYIFALFSFVPHYFIYVPLALAFLPIFLEALRKLAERKIGTEFFLTMATIISVIGGQEKAMSIVLLIMLIAQYIESLISERTDQAIAGLISLIPKQALVQVDHEEKVVTLSELKVGMKVIVKTGGNIPVDGVIIKGSASINEASLTGESIPVEKSVNNGVFAGTFIEAGSIIIKTEKIGADTFFGKINELVQKSEQKKAKIAILTDTISFYLVPLLLGLIGLTWLITKNLKLVTTLLVFGSPLELTLITPLAILAGIIAAYRNGILVKGGLVLERMAHADTIIFDKTGTLTIGEPVVIKIESYDPGYSEHEILKIAAIAEKRSDHVLAKAILKKAAEENIVISDPEHYVSVSGHGVIVTHANKTCYLGNKHFIEAPEHGNITIANELLPESQEFSSFYLACEGKLCGKIYIKDQIRSEAKESIDEIKQSGFQKIMLLSGDKQPITQHIASLLGITEAHGEVFPDQKLLIIEKLQKEKHIVAMVGDGINDAPALKQADVGIAMGAMGMEPAIEAADIVLITNELQKIVFVRALSKKIFRVINQNLILGFALIHGIGITLTFLGYIDPLKAALFHGFSDIAILFNSARLINFTLQK